MREAMITTTLTNYRIRVQGSRAEYAEQTFTKDGAPRWRKIGQGRWDEKHGVWGGYPHALNGRIAEVEAQIRAGQ